MESKDMNKRRKILIFFALLLGMILFPYIPLELFHINLNNFSERMKILYSLACDIGYLIIVFMVYFKNNIREFNDYLHNFKKYFKISISYYLIGLVLMYASNYIIGLFFSQANPNNDIAVKQLIDRYPGFMLFSTLVYAPIVEETIFRRSIKEMTLAFGNSRITKYIYIILSGCLFAFMHIIGMVNNSYDYLYVIPYLSLGIAFAALYYKTDNLFTTILLHFFHNLFAIILYFLIGV